MPGYRRIYRAADGKSIVTNVLNRTRELLAESIKLLGEPAPDTFLGRRRREIAPLPDRGKSEPDNDETIPPVMS